MLCEKPSGKRRRPSRTPRRPLTHHRRSPSPPLFASSSPSSLCRPCPSRLPNPHPRPRLPQLPRRRRAKRLLGCLATTRRRTTDCSAGRRQRRSRPRSRSRLRQLQRRRRLRLSLETTMMAVTMRCSEVGRVSRQRRLSPQPHRLPNRRLRLRRPPRASHCLRTMTVRTRVCSEGRLPPLQRPRFRQQLRLRRLSPLPRLRQRRRLPLRPSPRWVWRPPRE